MRDIADEIIKAMNANDEYIDTLKSLAPMVPTYDILEHCLSKGVRDGTIMKIWRDSKPVEVAGAPYLHLLAYYERPELLGFLVSHGFQFFLMIRQYEVNADGSRGALTSTEGYTINRILPEDNGMISFDKYFIHTSALQRFTASVVKYFVPTAEH